MPNKKNQELNEWIKKNPDSRELKRALAVKFAIDGWDYQSISEALNVSKSFISKWKKKFIIAGIEGLKLSYKGGKGYLNKQEKQEVITWLRKQPDWSFYELKLYLIEQYSVVFKSPSSYYYLIAQAKHNWQKPKKNNPDQEPDLLDKLLHCLYHNHEF
ncbi:helix-turn-helix domain-containing protein [Moorena sp. SIO3H5]|uniref:helix-turn-helix domain-containing protein n=1 Tax=Moorena sp. SIO3H5 TaxID=2607834 RepID=UPI0013B80E6A|nr:helix-turn-helix domain-containing protein [Moorena sp. SIO3H5]NEO69611.1 transposase [Moorena sp. SIO3H5]